MLMLQLSCFYFEPWQGKQPNEESQALVTAAQLRKSLPKALYGEWQTDPRKTKALGFRVRAQGFRLRNLIPPQHSRVLYSIVREHTRRNHKTVRTQA